MLKRNPALVALAIALVANLTAFAGNKNVLPNQKLDKIKVAAMAELKAQASHPHPGPHIMKSRWQWRDSEKPHLSHGNGHIRLKDSAKIQAKTGIAYVKSTGADKAVKEKLSLSNKQAEKPELSSKNEKGEKSENA